MPSIRLEYDIFAEASALDTCFQELIREAQYAAVHLSYAPYSGFRVGAAVLLAGGQIVKGSNQENASFPAGTCAERVALHTAAVLHPGMAVTAIAITYTKKEIDPSMMQEVLSPCGICRQVIHEVSQHQHAPIQLLMCSADGTIISVKNAKDLLPFSFGNRML